MQQPPQPPQQPPGRPRHRSSAAHCLEGVDSVLRALHALEQHLHLGDALQPRHVLAQA